MKELNVFVDLPVSELLDEIEERGTIEESALEALALEHDLGEDEVAALRTELEERGVEIACPRSRPRPTTRMSRPIHSALLMRDAGRFPLLTAAEEVELSKRVERGDLGGEGADDQFEPPSRHLDRKALPGPWSRRWATSSRRA